VASQLVREDEPMPVFTQHPPPPPPSQALRSPPRTPHLRLVVSHDRPGTLHFEGEGALQRIMELMGVVTAKV
jgi:hypothetical protein